MKEEFENIFEKNEWQGSGSGYGSEINYVAPFLTFFSHWLGKNRINSMVDLGCGDLQWTPYIFNNIPDFEYIGLDIVEGLIDSHSQEWEDFKFIEQDLIQIDWTKVPDVDLYFIKDVLQHWPNSYVVEWLDNFFKNNEEKTLMIVNCDLHNIRQTPQWTNHSPDRDMQIGEFKPLSQNHYPLSAYNVTEVFSWDTKKAYIVTP